LLTLLLIPQYDGSYAGMAGKKMMKRGSGINRR
jgi:hypothetical protein